MISENVRAVRNAGGRLLHLQGFLTDVTERRKAMMTIQESESRYRALFEKIPVAIFELDLSGLGRILQRWHADGVRDLTAHLAITLANLWRWPPVSRWRGQRNRGAADEGGVESPSSGRDCAAVQHAGIWGAAALARVIWQGHNDGEAEAELGDFGRMPPHVPAL